MKGFGFLKSVDLFQIHPNLYVPRTSSKTGKTEYSKKFGSLWGFGLTICFLTIALGYLSSSLFSMVSGDFDELSVNNYPFPYEDEKLYYWDFHNRFLPMYLIQPFDSTFNADDYDVYKDGEPKIVDGVLNVNFTKL
jgi:hypothetical protein